MLEFLSLERPDDVQANTAGEEIAKMLVCEKSQDLIAPKTQLPADRAEHRRKMSARWIQIQCGPLEDAPGRREKSLALGAAGTIGDMIGVVPIVEFIQKGQSARIGMGCGDKGQNEVAKLRQMSLGEGLELAGVADFSLLAGGFQT